MGNIFYIMGKSSSGKDTLFQEIKKKCPALQTVVPYTTRPIRSGEEQGKDYFFVDEKKLSHLQEEGKVIELREYDTIHGVWKYFTVDDGQVDLLSHSYLMIGTLESYEKIRDYYGEDNIVPIYIEVETGERLFRALQRERMQAAPKYKELCRRFIADEEDFSEEQLRRLFITRRFQNDEKKRCLEEIVEVICNGKL